MVNSHREAIRVCIYKAKFSFTTIEFMKLYENTNQVLISAKQLHRKSGGKAKVGMQQGLTWRLST